jgi:hypothetical protein
MFEQVLDKAVLDAVEKLLALAKDSVKKELQEQGHVLTGALINTIETELQAKRFAIIGLVWLNDYFHYLDRALPADKVPYQPGSGRRSSKVVTALERYWRLRGLSPKEATRATFATLNKWKQDGRPTRASFRFSKNGRRTGFLAATVERIEAQAEEVLGSIAESTISDALTRAIRAAL